MLRQKIIQAKKEIRLRRTGFAPVSPAWEADQLTTLITNRTLALSDLLFQIYISCIPISTPREQGKLTTTTALYVCVLTGQTRACRLSQVDREVRLVCRSKHCLSYEMRESANGIGRECKVRCWKGSRQLERLTGRRLVWALTFVIGCGYQVE